MNENNLELNKSLESNGILNFKKLSIFISNENTLKKFDLMFRAISKRVKKKSKTKKHQPEIKLL